MWPSWTETAKFQNIGENMEYVRELGNPTEELQHQYKTSNMREEKETLDVVEWEHFKRKWEVVQEYCDSPMLLSRRLQPLEVRRLCHAMCSTILPLKMSIPLLLQIFQGWLAARKKKWTQQKKGRERAAQTKAASGGHGSVQSNATV